MVFIDGTVTTGPNGNSKYINFTIRGNNYSVYTFEDDEQKWIDLGQEDGTYEDYQGWGIHFIPQELL